MDLEAVRGGGGLRGEGGRFKLGPFLSLIFLHHVNDIEHNIKKISMLG